MTKSKQGSSIPSLTEFDSYVQLVAKRDQIVERQCALNKEISVVNGAIAQLRESGETYDSLAVKAQAAILLGEPPPPTFPDQAIITRLSNESAAIASALETLNERIEAERLKISAEICKQVKPEHDRLVVGVCDALIRLYRAKGEYDKFTNALNDEHVAWAGHLKSMRPDGLRIGFERGSAVASYVKEAAKYGMIDATALPKEWADVSNANRSSAPRAGT